MVLESDEHQLPGTGLTFLRRWDGQVRIRMWDLNGASGAVLVFEKSVHVISWAKLFAAMSAKAPSLQFIRQIRDLHMDKE